MNRIEETKDETQDSGARNQTGQNGEQQGTMGRAQMGCMVSAMTKSCS